MYPSEGDSDLLDRTDPSARLLPQTTEGGSGALVGGMVGEGEGTQV